MGNTYAPLYLHFIWSTYKRETTIVDSTRNEVERIILTIAQNLKTTPITIFAMPDHVHLLLKLPPSLCPSDVIGQIKRRSSRLFNEHHSSQLRWQKGYGAFTISMSHVQRVSQYINNQISHHKKQSFKEEYINWLQYFNVEYDLKYVFNDD